MEERDVVQCPHCAEDILRAAVKCKHCGERVSQPAPKAIERAPASTAPPRRTPPAERRPKKDKPGRILGIILVLAGTATLLLLPSLAAPERQAAAYGLAASFLVLGPIAWNIGNALRRYAMPSGVLTPGFVGSLSSRLFWTYGPQFKALFAAFFVLSLLVAQLVKPGEGGGGAQPAGVVGAEVKAAPVEQTETPSPETPDSLATSEHEPVGVPPTSECDAPAVRASLDQKARQFTGAEPVETVDGVWWDISRITTIGPTSDGHQCHAYLNMHSGTDTTKNVPINYTTKYEDFLLTVEASFVE